VVQIRIYCDRWEIDVIFEENILGLDNVFVKRLDTYIVSYIKPGGRLGQQYVRTELDVDEWSSYIPPLSLFLYFRLRVNRHRGLTFGKNASFFAGPARNTCRASTNVRRRMVSLEIYQLEE